MVKDQDSHVHANFKVHPRADLQREKLERWGRGWILCFQPHLSVGWESHMCSLSGTLICHLLALYLVLIVTLLMSTGMFRSPQAEMLDVELQGRQGHLEGT